jgi:hypothetical protein
MSDAAFRNGVPRSASASSPPRRGFALRLMAGRAPGKVEAVVAAAVIASVFCVAFLILQMPGPLVVQVRDDANNPVMGAQVGCSSPSGDRRFTALTDVFGEAKWPGLVKGFWRCDLAPPSRFHAPPQEGGAVVEARRPALWRARVERPARMVVRVQRPQGAPRAAVAVRAVCSGGDGASWEARAGVLDGSAILWLPHGRRCRVGLVRPELPARQPGPVARPALECESAPCAEARIASVGEELSAELAPSRDQWEAVRPLPEPDSDAK